MGEYRRFAPLIAIMIGAAASVASVPLALVYEATIERERRQLLTLVEVQARLLDVLADHDDLDTAGGRDHPPGMVSDLVVTAHRALHVGSLSPDSELLLARQHNDNIVWLSRIAGSRSTALPSDQPFDTPSAQPMREALSGRSGTMISVDGEGERVLAAFTPLRHPRLGLVALTRLQPVRRRFLAACLIGALASALVGGGGIALFFSMHRRLIKRLDLSDSRYRLLFEQMAGPVLVYAAVDAGRDFQLLDLNSAAAASQQLRRDQAIGRRLSELCPGIASTPVPAALHQVWITGETVEVAPYFYRDARIEGWRACRIYRLPTTDLAILCRDVGERVAAEARLRESEERFRTLVETQPDLVCQYHPDTTLTCANDSFCRFFQRSAETIIGSRWIDLMPVETRSQVMADLSTIDVSTPHVGREMLVIRGDGERRWLLWHHQALFDPGGRILSFQSLATDVTERRQAVQAMHESEARLQAVLDHSPALISIQDLSGTFVVVNTRHQILDGPPFETLIGRSLFDVYPAAAEQMWRNQLTVIASRQPIETEETLRHRDRSDHTYVGVLFALFGDNGPFGVCHIRTDITARKQAEAALDENRLRNRALLDASQDSILLVGTDGTVLVLNKAAAIALTTADSAERAIVGKSLTALLPTELASSILALIAEAAHDQVPQYAEYVTGGRWYEISLYPVRQPDAPVREIGCYARDVTERRHRDAMLRTLEQAVRQSPVAVVITDRHGDIEYVNPQFCESSGYSPEELIGKNPRILKSGYTSSDEYNTLWRTICAGQVWRGELQNRRKDGSLYWELGSIAAVRNENGEIINFIGIMEDITETKLLEEQLRSTQQLQALGQLTGGIAHDFNNLLAIIVGNLELLAERTTGLADAPALIADALWSAERGAELTRRLLAFARRQPLDPKRVDLNSVVRGLSGMLRRTLGTGIVIVEHLAADLWPSYLDESELERALVNVAVNARDAMGTLGTLTIETRNTSIAAENVDVRVEGAPGDYAVISLADTGTGMSPETLQRVFEPFFTTKAFGRGRGLGLSMVYGFARQSGGHVRITSTLGKGTSVALYLPRASDDGETAASTDRRPPAGVLNG